ncbi:MAG: 16S rRNA processing protein RimM [Thermomicrobiales bacterium]|nr:16S rRNA processing protein RimM [Thermomicrobiales bacterium]
MPASTSTGSGPTRPARRLTPAPVSRSHREPGESRYQTGRPAKFALSHHPQPLIETAGPAPETPPSDVKLVVGVVVGVHGVDGEMKIRPLTDNPAQFEMLKEGFFGSEEKPRRIRGVRFHGGNVLVRVAGVVTREDAAAFRGYELRVRTSQLEPLEEGEFFLYQVIGLTAFDEHGAEVGKVVDLIETGSTDVFAIAPVGGGQQILLANLPDVVLAIEPVHNRIIVRIPAFYE